VVLREPGEIVEEIHVASKAAEDILKVINKLI
jgi:hypothetical protein